MTGGRDSCQEHAGMTGGKRIRFRLIPSQESAATDRNSQDLMFKMVSL
jgi:hypothetical protein